MEHLLSLPVVLGRGVIILMDGILIDREPKQSIQSALNDSLGWGAAFLIFFGSEFWLLGNV